MSLVLEPDSPPDSSRREARLGGLRAILALLDDADRQLAELTFVHNVSQRRAADAMRLGQGTAARRTRWLRELFLDPATHAVAAVVDTLDADDRRFAVDYFFRGHSVQALARAHGLDRRAAHRRVDYFRGWARGLVRSSRTQD